MELQETTRNDSYSIQFSATEDGKKVGWAFVVIVKNDRHAEPYALLEDVYVEPEYRGRGIGTQLITSVINKAKSLNCYKLITQSRYSKEGVHELYKKYGFRDHGKNFRIDLVESPILTKD